MNFFSQVKACLVISLGLYLTCGQLQAQDNGGKLILVQDPRVDSLVALNIAYNKIYPFITGYRIQIYMGSGNDALNNAEKVKEDFETNFEGITAYITFREPYYRVRAGDFRTRLQANQLLKALRKSYQDAWIIQDKINLPLLMTYQKTDSYE